MKKTYLLLAFLTFSILGIAQTPEHYYYGDVNGFNSSNGTMPAKLEKPFTSYLEIGFYRCLDLFN
jgi:hypothetical protein